LRYETIREEIGSSLVSRMFLRSALPESDPLKVIIRFLKLIIEEEIALRKLEVTQIKLINDIVSQDIG
jgi:hypothetical protein